MPSFGPIAPHYDVLMKSVPYDMWAGYLRLIFATLNVDPDTLLDVCCGTGTVAELLTSAGYTVSGFDLSRDMIEMARKKAAERDLDIDYLVADATNFELNQTFDAAYSFFDSLNYITTLEGFRAAIANVRKHLAPDGLFVFDLNTAYSFEQRMFDQSDLRPRSPIRYKWVGHYDPDTRIIEVDMQFFVGDRTFNELHRQRAHSPAEVEAALRDAGFKRFRVFESYTLDAPRKTTDRVHYAAW